MPYYALYYFRQATKLRPGDARFWCAMGQCYESEELNIQDAALQVRFVFCETSYARSSLTTVRLISLVE